MMNSFKFKLLKVVSFLALLAAGDSALQQVRAHGSAGGEEPLPPGEFRAIPVITIEGHGGFENNLEGHPEHYGIDGQFGVVLEWGLPNEGSFAIEASLGPALVWGEAEHFYGRVHVESGDHDAHEGSGDHEGHDDHEEHEDHADDHEDHEDHAEEHGDHEGHDDHDEHEDHAEAHDDHEDHDEGHEGHDDHAGHAGHGHGSGAPFRRTDIKGYLQARYQPNERLELSLAWMPYYVTGEGEDFGTGLKNEVGAKVVYAFGDGDVNFALGDGLQDVIDGVFVSVENRTGWESDGTYIGNYTDLWPGFGFNIDLLNITLSGGPRFYIPGDYSGLSQRTDWGGEIELEYPVAENVVLFAHWEPVYSTEGGSGWGVGFQHHVGTGVTIAF
ncbi:putative conserved secreted protein [Synechococcus sp. A18-25c]|nr:putative conserved secreted protein [Synechococcus sp. A15-60]QNJ20383.1 putative conserved secreted protein [Synechococcus sp. A18-25c]